MCQILPSFGHLQKSEMLDCAGRAGPRAAMLLPEQLAKYRERHDTEIAIQKALGVDFPKADDLKAKVHITIIWPRGVASNVRAIGGSLLIEVVSYHSLHGANDVLSFQRRQLLKRCGVEERRSIEQGRRVVGFAAKRRAK